MLYASCGISLLWLLLEPTGLGRLPLPAYLAFGTLAGLLGGLNKYRAMVRGPAPVEDTAHFHALCSSCYHEEVPGRDPPRVPLADRTVEVCCKCGDSVFDGIFFYREEPFPLCDHGE